MTPESDEQREQGARDVEKWQREELAREQAAWELARPLAQDPEPVRELVAAPKRGLLERLEDWIRGRLK